MGGSLSSRSGIFWEDGDGGYFFLDRPCVQGSVGCVMHPRGRAKGRPVSLALEVGTWSKNVARRGRALAESRRREERARAFARTHLVCFRSGTVRVEWSGEKKTRISRVSAIHNNIYKHGCTSKRWWSVVLFVLGVTGGAGAGAGPPAGASERCGGASSTTYRVCGLLEKVMALSCSGRG